MFTTRYTFKKAERLCSKKLINELFVSDQVNRIRIYPFVLIYKSISLQTNYPAQVLISVGKKYSKKAVERNIVKRQLRELYRTNKHLIYNKLDDKQVQLALLLLFVGKENFEFSHLKLKFEEIISHLIEAI